MPRAGLTTAAVVDAALEVIDERGIEALTLTAVAAHTGVATPSLYNHVASLAELRERVSVRVLEQMSELFAAAAAGHDGPDAVASLLRTYRDFVRRFPARYAALPADPLHEPALVDAGRGLLEVVLSVLGPFDLSDADRIHAARRLRVIAHGFSTLEAAGGFGLPEDLDQTYEQLIEMVLASLTPRR